jgi:hypothetical protein
MSNIKTLPFGYDSINAAERQSGKEISMKIQKSIPNYPAQEGPLNIVGPFPVDPLGSYTGRAKNPDEKPIQDADDL